MLDAQTLTRKPDWRAELRYGDVVSFRFPVAENNDVAPKARPCLILDFIALGSRTFVSLAYGTSAETNANRGHDIRISDAEELMAAGLHKPTRFVGARRILVALEHSGFVVNRILGTPVLGHLTGGAHHRMNRVRGRIHAEADIAAERRVQDLRERQTL